MSRSDPERTCLGCGKKAAKAALFRVVLDDAGGLQVDFAQCAPGRGGYLCGLDCWPTAMKKKAIGRAFRGRWKGIDRGVEAALRGRAGSGG